jgi:hypothetical protein
MRILSIILIVLVLSGVADAKRRRRARKKAHAVPVQIIRDNGNGTFNVQAQLKEITEFLNREGIRYRVGQGAVHNRFGLNHTNAMDVSARPGTSKGIKLTSYLRAKKIPFLAISGRKKGVSTAPHFHVGFPSKRTEEKFPVGAVDGTTNSKICPIYQDFILCF